MSLPKNPYFLRILYFLKFNLFISYSITFILTYLLMQSHLSPASKAVTFCNYFLYKRDYRHHPIFTTNKFASCFKISVFVRASSESSSTSCVGVGKLAYLFLSDLRAQRGSRKNKYANLSMPSMPPQEDSAYSLTQALPLFTLFKFLF